MSAGMFEAVAYCLAKADVWVRLPRDAFRLTPFVFEEILRRVVATRAFEVRRSGSIPERRVDVEQDLGG